MGKKGFKYYAVRKGKVPGVYTDWGACADQVVGVSGAVFKGFNDLNDAIAFVGAVKKPVYVPPERREEGADVGASAASSSSADTEDCNVKIHVMFSKLSL